MRKSSSILFFLAVLMPLFMMACGGGGGGGYNPPPAPKPVLSVAPALLAFSAVQDGSNPASQTFTVTNSGSAGSTLNYAVSKAQPWLMLGSTSGSLGSGQSAAVSVSVNISGLAAGSYADTITVSAAGATNSPQTVAVTLNVTAAPVAVLSVSPATLSFSATQGGLNPAGQIVTITNSSSAGSTLNYAVSKAQPWLMLSLTSGSLGSGQSAAVSVSVNISGLAAGGYTDTITVSAQGAANSPQALAVTLNVAAPVVVSISPTSATLTTGSQQQFTATVTGTTNTAVTWSATCGTVSASGLCTAPSTAGTCNVTATSLADTTKSATAVVTVTAPVIVVTMSPTTASVQAGTTQQFTATVTGTSNTAVTWSAVKGTINQSGLYTAPAAAGTDIVTARSVADTAKSASAAVTITAAPIPTISISPTSATLAYGSSADLQLTVSGNYGAPTCPVTGPGSVSLNGTTLTYSVAKPTTVTITVWAATFACTATNSVGQTATATVDIVLTRDPAVITSVSPSRIFCPTEYECVLPGPLITVKTSGGLYDGGVLHFGPFDYTLVAGTPDFFKNQLQISSPTEVWWYQNFDTPHYDPGRWNITADSPTDSHGGGTSNTAYLDFLGNSNMLVMSLTEAFQLNQVEGLFYRFRLSDGGSDGRYPSNWLVYGVAIDDKSGNLLSTVVGGVYEFTVDGRCVASATLNFPMAAAAKGGYGCVSQPLDGLLTSLDLSQIRLNPISTAVGNTPWNVAATAFGNQLACVSFNVEDLQLSVVKIPETTLWNSTTLVGLTLKSQLRPPDGGWQFAVFAPVYDAATQTISAVAALLSQYDRVVMFTKLTVDSSGNLTIAELPAVSLGKSEMLELGLKGVANRIAPDDRNGVLVVSSDENSDGLKNLTRLLTINPATGAVSLLQSQTSKLAVGLGVSPMDNKIVLCERSACDFLLNQ